eukprot:12931109-Prorocentrum_lima.AAC.1
MLLHGCELFFDMYKCVCLSVSSACQDGRSSLGMHKALPEDGGKMVPLLAGPEAEKKEIGNNFHFWLIKKDPHE